MRLRAPSCLPARPGAPRRGAAELMVVGRGGESLLGAARPRRGRSAVKVDGHRCRVAGRTPLAALARTPAGARGCEDFGACGSGRPTPSGLYVRGVEGQRERGADGWVYKIGNKAPSLGAGDRRGTLRRSARVLWFWCATGRTAASGRWRSAPRADGRPGRAARACAPTTTTGRACPPRGRRCGSARRAPSRTPSGVAAPARPRSRSASWRRKPGVVRSFPVRCAREAPRCPLLALVAARRLRPGRRRRVGRAERRQRPRSRATSARRGIRDSDIGSVPAGETVMRLPRAPLRRRDALRRRLRPVARGAQRRRGPRRATRSTGSTTSTASRPGAARRHARSPRATASGGTATTGAPPSASRRWSARGRSRSCAARRASACR